MWLGNPVITYTIIRLNADKRLWAWMYCHTITFNKSNQNQRNMEVSWRNCIQQKWDIQEKFNIYIYLYAFLHIGIMETVYTMYTLYRWEFQIRRKPASASIFNIQTYLIKWCDNDLMTTNIFLYPHCIRNKIVLNVFLRTCLLEVILMKPSRMYLNVAASIVK